MELRCQAVVEWISSAIAATPCLCGPLVGKGLLLGGLTGYHFAEYLHTARMYIHTYLTLHTYICQEEQARQNSSPSGGPSRLYLHYGYAASRGSWYVGPKSGTRDLASAGVFIPHILADIYR